MTEEIAYRSGEAVRSTRHGSIQAHVFQNVLGPDRITIPEHSVLLAQSSVTITDIWEGERVAKQTHEPDTVRFLPAGTTLSSEDPSNRYNDALIRLPEQVFRDAVRCHDYRGIGFRFYSRATVGLPNVMLRKMFAGAPRLLIESMATSIAVMVMCDLCCMSGNKLRQPSPGLSPERMRRLSDYIEANLAEPISLHNLSQVACMSSFHLIRSFKASAGVTPFRYIQSRRIIAAKRLLAMSDMRVVDVAYSCGFANQSHFATAFKELTGQTPIGYRRASAATLIASLFFDWQEALSLLDFLLMA